jgi:hypothetical protein
MIGKTISYYRITGKLDESAEGLFISMPLYRGEALKDRH